MIAAWRRDTWRRALQASALAWLGVSASGCYERVVAAEGIGTDAYDVHEPNLKGDPGPVEDFVFGPREPNKDMDASKDKAKK
jgi:hypothetical protein